MLLALGGIGLWYQDYLKREAEARYQRELEIQKIAFQAKEDASQLTAFLDSSESMHREFDQTLRKRSGVFRLQNIRQEWTKKLQSTLERRFPQAKST